jgi:hypothetical protein
MDSILPAATQTTKGTTLSAKRDTQHTFRYIGGGRLLQLKVLGLAGYWAGGSITE